MFGFLFSRSKSNFGVAATCSLCNHKILNIVNFFGLHEIMSKISRRSYGGQYLWTVHVLRKFWVSVPCM